MLNDPSLNVRNNAALALVRFGDGSGHAQIMAMLHPAVVTAPQSGRVVAAAKPSDPIRNGTMVARIDTGSGAPIEVRAPITGTLATVAVHEGDHVNADAVIASVAPGDQQLWEALRALYLIGTPDDLEYIRPLQRESMLLPGAAPEPISSRVRQQARDTEQAIVERAKTVASSSKP
jgi:multidrug efflux pump subunit AcrA (membrane-fusion protein)